MPVSPVQIINNINISFCPWKYSQKSNISEYLNLFKYYFLEFHSGSSDCQVNPGSNC